MSDPRPNHIWSMLVKQVTRLFYHLHLEVYYHIHIYHCAIMVLCVLVHLCLDKSLIFRSLHLQIHFYEWKYRQISNIRRTLVSNKIADYSELYLEYRLSAQLQLHFHSKLNTWLHLSFGATYIRDLIVSVFIKKFHSSLFPGIGFIKSYHLLGLKACCWKCNKLLLLSKLMVKNICNAVGHYSAVMN